MNDTIYLALIIVNSLFLFIWGAYERISAIRTGRMHAVEEDRDRGSLIIFYATILLGYGVGIPVAFTGYGKIDLLFPCFSIAGFLITGAGLAIRLVAKKTLDTQFTYTVKIIDNHKLISTGVYKYIRHPSYLGQSLIFLGCGVAYSNWLSIMFLFVPNFLAGLYRISVEERVLKDHFTDRYVEYMKHTKRLVPWVY